MKVAVIGCGFVGEAVADFLETHLIPVYKVDPAKYSLTLDDISHKTDAFILCLPTPEREDGTCDDSAIKAVIKEAITGALLGVLMMLVVFPFAWWQGEGPLIASAVGISLICITTLAATAGAILPLLFDRLRLDPALMSSPFITTVTDIAGVFIYLTTAKWLLSSSII